MTLGFRLLVLMLFVLPPMAHGQSTDAKDGAASAPVEERGSDAGELKGTLDPMHIRDVIQGRRADLRACYMAGVRQDPTLAGAVTFRFEIARSGRVSSLEVERDTLGSTQVLNCVATVIIGLRFDPPQGGGFMVVRYPFSFTTG